jgi:hypothetical protein
MAGSTESSCPLPPPPQLHPLLWTAALIHLLWTKGGHPGHRPPVLLPLLPELWQPGSALVPSPPTPQVSAGAAGQAGAWPPCQ